MKNIFFLSFLFIVMVSCVDHHDKSESGTHKNNDIILNISDSTIGSDCFLLINLSNNDLDSHGRVGILMAMQNRLKQHNIRIPVKIVFGEEEMSGLRKRLIKISRIDSLITILPEELSIKIKSKIKTNRPISILIDSTSKILMSGDICSPSYKQRIYNHYLGFEKASLAFKDSVIRIRQNPDTFIYLKNTDRNPLIIYEIESSCDCSKVTTEANIIYPNDSLRMYLTHTGNNHTKILTNILIYSNDKNGIREIKIDSSGKHNVCQAD